MKPSVVPGPSPAPVRVKDIPASSGLAVIAYPQACCGLDQIVCVKQGEETVSLRQRASEAIRGQPSTAPHGDRRRNALPSGIHAGGGDRFEGCLSRERHTVTGCESAR